MRLHWRALLAITVLNATAVHAAPPTRPDLATAKPIVTCKLQALAAKKTAPNEYTNALFYMGRPGDDPLSNYERTSLGDWPMLAAAGRTDPWLRVVLLSRKRPVVIDLAVLIDGKSFRDRRDSWIDELVSAPKPNEEKPPVKATPTAGGNKKPAESGTNSSAKTSDAGKTDGEKPEAEPKKSKPDEGPKTAVQSRQKPTMRARLADYLTTSKSNVDREEISWLIASWGAGPGVVLLDPSLSWQRSELSPLETYLDKNGDGAFSREEIAQAEATLQQADVDSNDVIDINEIRRTINHPAFALATGGYPLVVVLDANTDQSRLEAAMSRIYGAQPISAPGAKTTAPSVDALKSQPADITLQVNLGATNKDDSGISVLSLGSDLAKSGSAASATANVVTSEVDGDYLEFSGGQNSSTEDNDSAGAQVAIGAAFDGNPLLRLLDHDNDGRLTHRERQEVPGLFASLDHNKDGTVSASEVPIPIRFAVTLGPRVHELLATPVAAARSAPTRSESPTAPGWFTSMDKNSDGDLSRSEFLGTTDQFKQLDTNGDGLLGVAEALKLKTGK